jgi:phospholipase A1
MPFARRLLSIAVATAFPAFAWAQAPAECAGLGDDAQRLACYDAVFRSPGARPTPPDVAPLAPASARHEPSALQAVATTPSGAGLEASDYLTKFWELEPEARRGTFVVRTYSPNFLLPVHYSNSINKSPKSPTHPKGGTFSRYRQTEAELQLSLRAKVVDDFVLPNASVWVAYTQRSIWQLWNGQDSSPFRSSDYQPEGMLVVPIPDRIGDLGGGWRWRLATAGIAHESNGQAAPLSRSWNFVYAGTALTHDDVGLQLRYNRRLYESGDDNPHITDYIGSTELTGWWLPNENTLQLIARTSFKTASRGSLEFTWTRPIVAAKPDGLRWYVQLFSGYGETMLDYNHRQTSVGLGFTLFQL